MASTGVQTGPGRPVGTQPVAAGPGGQEWPGGIVLFTPGTPNNLTTVENALGDTGTAADGFDAELSAVMALTAGLDADAATSDAMIAALAASESDFESLPDEVSAELAAMTELYDADEAGLGAAIAALATLGAGPQAFSIPGVPVITGIVAPVAVDVTALVAAALGAAVSTFEDTIDSYLDQILQAIVDALASSGGGGGGGGTWSY